MSDQIALSKNSPGGYFKWLLEFMTEKNASDLHLCVGAYPFIRVSGDLISVAGSDVLGPDKIENIISEILPEHQKKEFDRTKELDFSYGLSGLARFRINLSLQRGCATIAVRRIPYEIPTMQELGLPEILTQFTKGYTGLFLVTGPTGSGKSTTLASMIEYINQRRPVHLVTLEDPIEYLFSHKQALIMQREVGRDTLSFAGALRRVVRQDPDVIMIGEMRDLETVHSALTLAETGHLVLATLHTFDTTHAVTRIIDSFPAHHQYQIRVQLSMVLMGVISQQLLPRQDGNGRVLAYELLVVDDSVSNLIRENVAQIRSVLQTRASLGMCTMNQNLASLVDTNIVTYDEALKRCTHPEELDFYLKEKKKKR